MSSFSSKDFDTSLVIFTDGASSGNPGPGGYGAVVVFPKLDEVVELGGNKTKTTNNEMEMSAVIAALSHTVFNTAPTHIFTDSAYVINGITKWISGWENNGWKTKDKKDVANKNLWENLASLVREREKTSSINWHLVGGHIGIIGNERCDEIATGYATGKPVSLYRGTLSQYGKDILRIEADEKLVSQKAKSKSSGTGKAYSYVSYVDGKIAVHGTWAECEARVRGKQARYAKALSAEHEAELIDTFLGKA